MGLKQFWSSDILFAITTCSNGRSVSNVKSKTDTIAKFQKTPTRCEPNVSVAAYVAKRIPRCETDSEI